MSQARRQLNVSSLRLTCGEAAQTASCVRMQKQVARMDAS